MNGRHHLPKQYYLLLNKVEFYCNHHHYGKAMMIKEPETDFQKWLVELFNKLHNLTENNHIPKSHFTEYDFQKIGKNFSYPVSEKFATSENNVEACEEEVDENTVTVHTALSIYC